MDALDRLAEPGLDLLDRVDTLLARGAPEHHPVWPLLRRLQVLPGAALHSFLGLHPAPLATAGHAVRQLVRGYDQVCATLSDQVAWSGPAASAYGRSRAALLHQIDEGPDSLVGRLESTAGYADALADWVDRSRVAVARTLADVLGSAEAVAVVAATSPGREPSDGGAGVGEAAEIARRVLAVLSVAYDGAETLLREWSPSLGPAPWRQPPQRPVRFDAPTRLGW
ncbi:hypothetical protein [Micromonospora sp. SH-82]|uniref:hypothetical protein n=1 Tax=Micromonospora sp. SH-82 TaxID=3132938 RepID=UPI003EB6CDE8